ncbi:MAG: hypothetical protein ACRDQD_04150 [Nocardioidaceae bacterium]
MSDQHAESVAERNPCRLAHRMHIYDLFPWFIAGYTIEKCANCGLTKEQVRRLDQERTDAV